MKNKTIFRPVPSLDPVIWEEAYNYLLERHEEILIAVSTAIDQGYSPEEIYRHWLREAGYNREELAKRCKNAAKHLIRVVNTG
jgi:hypothetical protein